jgi:hypothetical protein
MDEKIPSKLWMKNLDEKSYIQLMDEKLYTWMNPISS